MYRYDIINLLISKNNYKSYLEIGVRDPKECLDLIKCELKHGVDPGVESKYEWLHYSQKNASEFITNFNVTSDEFFQTNQRKYDIIFIDGLHIDEQVERDILNSLRFLNEGGSIVLHDCNPPDIWHAREDFDDISTPASYAWNGTVWKSIVRCRELLPNASVSVVDTDYGVGIIQITNQLNYFVNDNKYFSYRKFEQNKKYYLNLISVDEFLQKYIYN